MAASLLDAIPAAWRFSDTDVPSDSQLKDFTSFIVRFLSPLERDITSSKVAVLLDNVQSLRWSAVEITRAFCHRAALAHQLVSAENQEK